MNTEIWKPVVGFEGLYEVSNYGNLKGLKRGKNLKSWVHRCGYVTCKLHKNGKWKCFSVHRLEAIAFIPNPENKPQVNHKDTNKANNYIDNLEWCNNSENQLHASANGKAFRLTGSKHHASRAVLQYSISGEFIKEYATITQASMESKISQASIFLCCSGKTKRPYTYVWKYK